MRRTRNIIMLFILVLLIGIFFADPQMTIAQGTKYNKETIGHVSLVNPGHSRNRIIVDYCTVVINYDANGKEYTVKGEVTSDMIATYTINPDIKVSYMEDSPEKIMLKDINNKVVLELYAFYLAIILALIIICKIIKILVKKKKKKEEE